MDAIFNSFLGFDLSVFEWVQSIHSSFLTTLMVIITTLGDEGIIFIAMGIVLLLTKKYRKVGFAVLVALVGTYMPCILKMTSVTVVYGTVFYVCRH